jgi:hypothetical protein
VSQVQAHQRKIAQKRRRINFRHRTKEPPPRNYCSTNPILLRPIGQSQPYACQLYLALPKATRRPGIGRTDQTSCVWSNAASRHFCWGSPSWRALRGGPSTPAPISSFPTNRRRRAARRRFLVTVDPLALVTSSSHDTRLTPG